MTSYKCRFCNHPLEHVMADLGMTPLANAFVPEHSAHLMEPFYPLKVFTCDRCFLSQLAEFETPEHIFENYLYFSSFSTSWLTHCEQYVEMMTKRFVLNKNSLVVELASNDGYLLQYFVKRNIPVLGVEPAGNVAEAANEKGVCTKIAFFGEKLAHDLLTTHQRPDLIIANNVLAHVPDLHDFIKGMKLLLSDKGIITIEFPHLLQLMQQTQFDTIYHEHFSYFSLSTVETIVNHFGLRIFDVETLSTHGGSLRLFLSHESCESHKTTVHVSEIKQKEADYGLNDIRTYARFNSRIIQTKVKILEFLLDCHKEGKRVAGYGAPAKGNTLLNFCGIGPELVPFTVDKNPHKQNYLLPGTRIPIFAPEKIQDEKPDFVLILPWNLSEEVRRELSFIKSWSGRFVTPIPELKIF